MDSRDDCRLRAYAAEKQLEELEQENARLREAVEKIKTEEAESSDAT